MCVLLMLSDGLPEAGVEKNNPLTTAFAPAVRVTFTITCPCRFHTRYCPPLKLEIVRVSSTAFVPASRMSTRSAREVVSKSRQYSENWCVLPSVRFTSKLMLENVYQPEAMRLFPASVCGARTSLVGLAQITDPCPLMLTEA